MICLHPSELAPEERLDELSDIFAAGILRLRTGVNSAVLQAEGAQREEDKSLCKTESSLEVTRNQSLHVAGKGHSK